MKFLLLFLLSFSAVAAETPLPAGTGAVWDLQKAERERTSNSDRVCLNGLWRWQPATGPSAAAPPIDNWGWFKVPGPWPGITDYMQKDSQTLYANESWKDAKLSEVTAAWYQREITVPENWQGQGIAIQADYLNSFAAVFVDGKRAGEIHFPAGECDVTEFCGPGKHTLSMLVIAMPLKGVLLSYTDSASAREVKGSVARRGLCGDVFLTATSRNPRIGAVKIDTSFRKGEISFSTTLSNLTGGSFRLSAHLSDGTILESSPFAATNRFSFTAKWKPKKLWDIHTPTNQSFAIVSLRNEHGEQLDETRPQNFGFREVWIDGRDFYLNGTRIFLSAVPLDNAEVGVAWATYDAAEESLRRLKSFGINFVYTHNYGCEPGSHLSFEEILRAADDVGMLVALSQPHFSHYDWKSPDADAANGYARQAAFYTRVAGNHPSVVFYSMSHNATGYNEDMNPDMIDGLHDSRDQWSSNNARLALRAEAIVRALDSARIVYHHASGNLGVMHDMNFYPNFVPIQELSDWFGHWSTNGVKPAFMCEYGAPFTWDWTMYRGWFNGQREFGSARVPWEYCVAEWNAQFIGDRAYKISDAEKMDLRWEANQFRAGNLWHRWDYPVQVGSSRFDEQYPIHALYLTDNWRAFRGWGVSGISPWEHEHFWKLRDGVKRDRQDFKTDWQNLQRPGYSPDFIAQRYERMDMAFSTNDWIATEAARSLLRNNGPLLAFIAGKTEAFTSKDHNFAPGETVEKEIIVINNSRETTLAEVNWNFGSTNISLATGEQLRIPIRFKMPTESFALNASVHFSNGETQGDTFQLHAVAAAAPSRLSQRIALFDPVGETKKLLREEQIEFKRISANDNLDGFDILILGKKSLTVDGPAPSLDRVRDGLKVIVFEQTSQALEGRLGFRVEEYGLRNVFSRVPDHPVLKNVSDEELRDWRGASTLLPDQLSYEMQPRRGPTVKWAGISLPHIWRCGNRGNVASVLIEKPPRGDFLPILDGGYSLQFSPLLEYREGKGMILFCQLDVTGRTESDPVAEKILANIFRHVADWKPATRQNINYSGDEAGRSFLTRLGVRLDGDLPVSATSKALKIGGSRDFPANESEHIATWFEAQSTTSKFAGISPADLHNRDPRKLALAKTADLILGDGALAQTGDTIYCAILPWQFDGKQMNLRRTFRRSAFAMSRLLANAGANFTTPLLERFKTPVGKDEKRYLEGLYVDTAEEWDDPYRFFRW